MSKQKRQNPQKRQSTNADTTLEPEENIPPAQSPPEPNIEFDFSAVPDNVGDGELGIGYGAENPTPILQLFSGRL